jgi:hypothetical protein
MGTTFTYKNAYLSVGGSDISAYIQSCTLTGEYEELDVTTMGAATRNSAPGLGSWSIDVTCKQSWTAAELDAIIWPLVGAASASAIILKPNSSTTSVNNPKWTANGRIFSYQPMAGSVGDLAQTTFTIKPGDGTMIVRATSD